MRIISGTAKGRKLFAPAGDETRPTSDKIRGSVFNIIGSRVYDAQVLDLFGGTGALGLEAISRGAEHAVIVDQSRSAIQVIERNAQNVAKDDFDKRIRILKSDYRSAIGLLEGKVFDLIFLDPPYRMVEAYADALLRLNSMGCISEDALIVLERMKATPVSIPEGFESTDTRTYGETAVEFVRIRK
ncbi:MAG: 16S rRNA (guanine(966)-N(2))-methyltransferase RsmD [Clostridiales bacterium]|nr:16S rRNA (guanine(966)-N(2))-methyltransferase RsmD [Clostridiales bacterium]